MISWLSNELPWLGDILELGGDVLLAILLVAALMWALILERWIFLSLGYRQTLSHLQQVWQQRREHNSWYAQQCRKGLVAEARQQIRNHLGLIQTLIKLCPLLGLLGTVTGMLEVFDSMSASGNNSPQSMASGVSRATVSTMAGMVVAISGVLAQIILQRTAGARINQVEANLAYDGHNRNPS